jgi:hypothetical protein
LVSHFEGGVRLRVFKNKVLWKIFGPKRDTVTVQWRRLHNEELYDPYSFPNINQVIKSRRMRWTGYVVCMGNRRGVYRVLVRKTYRRSNLEDLAIDGRIL